MVQVRVGRQKPTSQGAAFEALVASSKANEKLLKVVGNSIYRSNSVTSKAPESLTRFIQEHPLDDRADFSVQVEEMLRSMYDIYSPGKNYEHMVHPTGTTVLTYCGTQPQEPSPGASPGRVPSAGKARHRYMHSLIYMHLPYGEHACNAVVFMSKLLPTRSNVRTADHHSTISSGQVV